MGNCCRSSLKDLPLSQRNTVAPRERPQTFMIKKKILIFSNTLLDRILKPDEISIPFWTDYCHIFYRLLPYSSKCYLETTFDRDCSLKEKQKIHVDTKASSSNLPDDLKESNLLALIQSMLNHKHNPLVLIISNFVNLLSAVLLFHDMSLDYCQEVLITFSTALRKVAILLFDDLFKILFASMSLTSQYMDITRILDSQLCELIIRGNDGSVRSIVKALLTAAYSSRIHSFKSKKAAYKSTLSAFDLEMFCPHSHPSLYCVVFDKIKYLGNLLNPYESLAVITQIDDDVLNCVAEYHDANQEMYQRLKRNYDRNVKTYIMLYCLSRDEVSADVIIAIGMIKTFVPPRYYENSQQLIFLDSVIDHIAEEKLYD